MLIELENKNVESINFDIYFKKIYKSFKKLLYT